MIIGRTHSIAWHGMAWFGLIGDISPPRRKTKSSVCQSGPALTRVAALARYTKGIQSSGALDMQTNSNPPPANTNVTPCDMPPPLCMDSPSTTPWPRPSSRPPSPIVYTTRVCRPLSPSAFVATNVAAVLAGRVRAPPCRPAASPSSLRRSWGIRNQEEDMGYRWEFFVGHYVMGTRVG